MCTVTFSASESGDVVTAKYSGVGTFAGSTSNTVTQVVNTGASTTQPTELSTKLSGNGQLGAWWFGRFFTVSAKTPVTDTATLAGVNASQATGTVTYTVFGWVQMKHRPFWKWEPVATGGTVTVSGGMVPDSSPVTLPPGIYEWQASYSGDSLNDPSMSVFGSEAELVIRAPVCPHGAAPGLGNCRAQHR
jgi:hypothetical protein